MSEVYVCDAIRTPIGRYGGTLSSVRADDLAAVPLKALMERNPSVDWEAVDDVIFGCANQAGEDNRNVSREDQDRFALWSQEKAAAAQQDGRLAQEIVTVRIPQRKGAPLIVDKDEHPRATSESQLSKLKAMFPEGTITAGNASGVNDGAAALLLATEQAARRYGLEPRARVLGMATAGVPPRIMGIGPVPATNKLLERLKLTVSDFDILELNEAFAAQALACTRELGVADDDPRINPQGGAIALGHPLGMSGARLVTTAVYQLHRSGGKRALCSMCIGVGQGISLALERV